VIEKKNKFSSGFTLIELMIALSVMCIASLAIGVVVVEGQNGWSTMYARTNSDVVTDGYVVRKKFDSQIRGANGDSALITNNGSSVEVYSSSSGSGILDRYTRFYVDGTDLNMEYGQLDPKEMISQETVCGNVSKCTFYQVGRSIQMILTLENGSNSNTIISSAMRHN
jgi:prepilin-type N-terminal cleavage/methylation domain-containing protein